MINLNPWQTLTPHLFWPIRWQRAAACRSFWGLKSLSMKITVSAAVRFKPTPPAKTEHQVWEQRKLVTYNAFYRWSNAFIHVAEICTESDQQEEVRAALGVSQQSVILWQLLSLCDQSPFLSLLLTRTVEVQTQLSSAAQSLLTLLLSTHLW